MAHTRFAEPEIALPQITLDESILPESALPASILPESALPESIPVRTHNHGWYEARELATQLGLRYRRASRRAPAGGRTEDVPLTHAAGRILAADVIAVADLPRFATAAMDGWVLSSCAPIGSPAAGTDTDTAAGTGTAPATAAGTDTDTGWVVDAAIAAGDTPSALPMSPGTARPISTGAPVPRGAAAVLRSELGEVSVDRAGRVWLRSPHPVRANEHIRPSGEEARQGEILLQRSVTLTPPRIALAAAAGRDTLTVLRHTAVELLLLGDELARTGHPSGGQVRDALGPAMPPIVAGLGLVLNGIHYVPDDLAATVAALRATTADIVVTTGGSSHGAADHVRGALRALGARFVFDGVAMRPGHPVILAELPDGRPVLCLPGNPLAALVCLASFAVPLADAMLGKSPRPLGLSMAASDLHNATASTRLVACCETADGLSPVDWQGSGMLRGLAHADTLAVIPPGGACAGEAVHTVPLPW